MTKTCKKCMTEKPLSEFNGNRVNRDGKCLICRACQKAYHRAYYIKNPDKFREKRIRDRPKTAERDRLYRVQNKEKIAVKIRSWCANNKDRVFGYHKKKYETVEGRAQHLLNGARKRVPEAFALTVEHVISALSKGHCPVTGIAFDLTINTNGKNNRSWTPYAPSLDKIDPKKGYTNENTRVVIWQYNVMKGVLTDAEVLAICCIVVERNAA